MCTPVYRTTQTLSFTTGEGMTRGLYGDDRLGENYFFIPFVASALQINSKDRPSAKELLVHPFLADEASALSLQLQDQEWIWGFHMNSDEIIAGSRKGSIHVIDANRLKKRRMTETENCHTVARCITSCGPVFAVAGKEGKISLWKIHSEQNKCELLKVINCHCGNPIACIKMNKNFLVSRGDDKNIVIHRRSQSNTVVSQMATMRIGATNQAGNYIGQKQEDLVQCGVIKLSGFSRPQSMVPSGDQLYFTDLHQLKHYSLSRSGEPQLVTQMQFKEELICLTESSEDMPASGATMKGDTSHPCYFWVGTYAPAKIMKVDLARKVVLAEVEVWQTGYIRQIETLEQYLLCILQEPKTGIMSCLCFALSDLPRAGVTSPPRYDHPVPFRQFVQFGRITSDICCRDDRHVFYYNAGDFHHLSVKQLEALPKQTSLTLLPQFKQ